MHVNLEDLLKQMADHDQTIDLENCPHCCTQGDNYGESCRHCGKQLKGYGNGGWFGSNLTGLEKCIHDYTGYGERRICRFCEKVEPVQEVETEYAS